MKKNFAFTLAEVLIALTIIGVVAALTVPTMIQSYQEKATVAKLRTVYSTLSQAFYMAKTEHGSPETWDWGTYKDGQSAVNVFREKLKPYLKVQKDCGIGTGCWYDGYIKNLQGQDCEALNSSSGGIRVILEDATSLALTTLGSCNTVYGTSTALQNVCGFMYVDINGKRSPNIYGKDVFLFHVTSQGVIPYGASNDTFMRISSCSLNNKTYRYNGFGCTAWVIEKGNMDYLRKEISW